MKFSARIALFLALLAGACTSPRPVALPALPRQAVSPGADAAPARLYARDGTVVSESGAVAANEPTAVHEPEGVAGSRYRMLELYQQVVDERDALALEVDRLNADLDASRAEVNTLRSELEATRAELEDVRAEVARLRDQNRELAGRLTTAQIRRLEAEKLLLEARIEWARLRAIGATDAPPPPLPEPGGLPREATEASGAEGAPVGMGGFGTTAGGTPVGVDPRESATANEVSAESHSGSDSVAGTSPGSNAGGPR